jgi:hypothetical protein
MKQFPDEAYGRRNVAARLVGNVKKSPEIGAFEVREC